MTIFGWDASHYDGALSPATMRLAVSQGIRFFTHKAGEGLGALDETFADAMDNARAAGIEVLGAYWFCHNGDDPAAEARKLTATLDASIPWWRTHPYFFIQADCETEAGQGQPSRAWIKKFAAQDFAGCEVVVYASHGEYGDGAISPLMWNANYGANPAGAFAAKYPGDGSAGWGPFSGYGTPVFLQYGSRLTIAGKTTCDANAFRGTLDDLKNLIGRKDLLEMPLTQTDADLVVDTLLARTFASPGLGVTTPRPVSDWLKDGYAAGQAIAKISAKTIADAVVLELPNGVDGVAVNAAVHAALAKLSLALAP